MLVFILFFMHFIWIFTIQLYCCLIVQEESKTLSEMKWAPHTNMDFISSFCIFNIFPPVFQWTLQSFSFSTYFSLQFICIFNFFFAIHQYYVVHVDSSLLFSFAVFIFFMRNQGFFGDLQVDLVLSKMHVTLSINETLVSLGRFVCLWELCFCEFSWHFFVNYFWFFMLRGILWG